MPELSDRDRAILSFEEEWVRLSGTKEAAIRDRFQWSAARYYQALNVLLDDPSAIAAYPILMKRLHRLRAARVAARAARRV